MTPASIPRIAVAGNPNSGKSTLFNALTGLRQKVSNYPGVTVEKHEGLISLRGIEAEVIDLPGTYTLNARSLDEQVAHDVLLGLQADTPPPQLILVVVDAANLERNLFLVTQILSLGKPVVLALNMMDTCGHAGIEVRPAELSRQLGVPVVPTVASRNQGIAELRAAMERQLANPSVPRDPIGAFAADPEIAKVSAVLLAAGVATPATAHGQALRVVSTPDAVGRPPFSAVRAQLEPAVAEARRALESRGIPWYGVEAIEHYRWIESVMPDVQIARPHRLTRTDRVDRWLIHPLLGPVALAAVVMAIFVGIFALAQLPMDLIRHAFQGLSHLVARVLPAGPVQSLVVDGVIAGVGSVVVFLPQIVLLFFFLAILEDTGYAARAAFILDRLMGSVGLHGRAFIPLFSSFGCAIPGVMATRTIDNARDRLLTILIAPLMCCAARWPVYLLVAGTVIPNRLVLGFMPLPALVLGSMVLLGLAAAIGAAAVFNRTILRGTSVTLTIELPRYRRPRLRTLLHVIWERCLLFLQKAGTIILAMSVIMWALTAYPRRPDLAPAEQVRQSVAGRFGRAIEPAIAPIGFDWRIGVAVLSSFVAREVFVSSLSTIYGVERHEEQGMATLQDRMQQDRDPVTGSPFFTPLRGLSIMVFYVLSMQCIGTMAIVRRETNSWRWPLFQWIYMTGMAWVACFLLWQGGRLLGWG